MQKLTAKQQVAFETIKEIVSEKKENPTAYGLQKYLVGNGTKDSLKSVSQVVDALEKKELIKRDEKRRIFVIENNSYADLGNMFSIPVYGLASCGEALAYAEDNVDGYLQVSQSLFRDKAPAQLFAVKALGDSMDKDTIHDGDYVIFEKYANQKDLEGQIVVAVINGMATIKRYKEVGDDVIGLFPHSTNSSHQPIFIHHSDSILIAGIFKRVLPVQYVSL